MLKFTSLRISGGTAARARCESAHPGFNFGQASLHASTDCLCSDSYLLKFCPGCPEVFATVKMGLKIVCVHRNKYRVREQRWISVLSLLLEHEGQIPVSRDVFCITIIKSHLHMA